MFIHGDDCLVTRTDNASFATIKRSVAYTRIDMKGDGFKIDLARFSNS